LLAQGKRSGLAVPVVHAVLVLATTTSSCRAHVTWRNAAASTL
jgi:hypothetical protein